MEGWKVLAQSNPGNSIQQCPAGHIHMDYGNLSLRFSAIVSQIKIRALRSGIEALAGLSGQRTQPAEASTPDDYLNIYSMRALDDLAASPGGGPPWEQKN